MPTVIRQDTAIHVYPMNRYGVNYNTVTVTTFMHVDQPFTGAEVMFVPSATKKVPDFLLAMMVQEGFNFAPFLSSELDAKLGNYLQEAKEGKMDELRKDSLLGLLVTYMDQIVFEPIKQEGNAHVYKFTYSFPLYPNSTTGEYRLKTTIPFTGLPTAGNFSMQFTLILPEGVQVDTTQTKGVAVNGQEIQEQVFVTQGNTNIVSFYWREDPTFDVVYKYQ